MAYDPDAKPSGQWIGTFSGSASGTIIVNFDEYPDRYEGHVYLNDSRPGFPAVMATLKLQDKSKQIFEGTIEVSPVHPNTGLPGEWDDLKSRFPLCPEFPTTATVEASWTPQRDLRVSWKTNIGDTGTGAALRSMPDKPSHLVPIELDWDGFKQHVSSLRDEGFLFRGQDTTWRLRTAFHRTGRADLAQFLLRDLEMLHRMLSATTKHVFNRAVPEENGAFLNLIQHHGYPTPLLDWTLSPYVAAFFAFRPLMNRAADQRDSRVRVFVFDEPRWRRDFRQLSQLLSPTLHVSVNHFRAIENQRTVAQQSASMLTNVDDVELYLANMAKDGRPYLTAVDLPLNERRRAIRDLRYMGVTAGSLFPGLDGMCEQLRGQNFDL